MWLISQYFWLSNMQIYLQELTEVTRTKPRMTGESIARFWSRIGEAKKKDHRIF